MDSDNKGIGTPLAIIGLGVAIASLVALSEPLSKLNLVLPAWTYFLFLATGFSVIIFGIVQITIALAPRPTFEINIKKGADNNLYECVAASRAELERLHRFCTDFFGQEGVSDLKRMRQLHNKNPEIFWQVFEVKHSDRQDVRTLVGYYSLIPLSRKASVLVEEEQANGSTFTTYDVVKSGNAKPASIYIGGVAAIRGKASEATMKQLREHLSRHKKQGVNIVYTRPITTRGLKLALGYGFRPVKSSDDGELGLNRIYKFDQGSGTESVASST